MCPGGGEGGVCWTYMVRWCAARHPAAPPENHQKSCLIDRKLAQGNPPVELSSPSKPPSRSSVCRLSTAAMAEYTMCCVGGVIGHQWPQRRLRPWRAAVFQWNQFIRDRYNGRRPHHRHFWYAGRVRRAWAPEWPSEPPPAPHTPGISSHMLVSLAIASADHFFGRPPPALSAQRDDGGLGAVCVTTTI